MPDTMNTMDMHSQREAEADSFHSDIVGVEVLRQLAAVLEARKRADPNSSYVARLYAKGLDAILQKIGEEAAETLLAAKNGDPEHLIHETADLWFHTLVMLAYQGLNPDAVLEELQRRFGLSGLEEKASRPMTKNT